MIGSSDEFGYKAEEQPISVHDLHATILHLLGLEHTKLTYRFNGRDMRLTDVYGAADSADRENLERDPPNTARFGFNSKFWGRNFAMTSALVRACSVGWIVLKEPEPAIANGNRS